MTSTPTPPPTSQRTGLRPWAIVLIVVGSLVLAGLVAVASVTLLWPRPVALSYSVDAGSSVEARVPDAPLRLHASRDGRVHVVVSGWHTGPAPKVDVRTSGDTTTIAGGCSRPWSVRCSIRVDVSLPATSDATVFGANGEVTATGLDGALRLATTNGTISVTDASGPLDLRTVNGAVVLRRATSEQVATRTTNGAVDLDFLAPPQTVTGHTINGAVSVRVPPGEDYRIVAKTVNGPVDTMASTPGAARSIRVDTVNGAVTVAHTAE